VAVAVAAILASPGWPTVRASFLDVHAAWDALPDIAAGMGLNLLVLLGVTPAVFVLGLALALMHSLRGPVWLPVRLAARAYTVFFLGLPLLINLYLVGFGLPGLRMGFPEDPLVLGGVALTLTYTAYAGEAFRAGIEHVDRSQVEAAYVDGCTHLRAMWHIVLPQAIRSVMPVLASYFVSLQKDCGLISVLGATDAVRAAQIHVTETFSFSPYLLVGFFFLSLAVPSGWLANRLGNRGVATP
jgi:polar amino acid transport system permease protein